MGTLFGLEVFNLPASAIVRLNTLAGGHPLRTLLSTDEPPRERSLNTLAGGHPLRTLLIINIGKYLKKVSIPSQVGTLFGLPFQTWA